MMPLVSLIIPTYNRATFISETLESVAKQSYTNWECIIVDDGSTDESAAIIGGFSTNDSRFKYFHRPENRQKGANACRNFGFEMSSGEFVNWIDSDDILDSEFLLQKVLAFDDATDAVASKTAFTKDNNEIIRYETRTNVVQDYFNEFICFRFKIYGVDVLWRRVFLENRTLWDEKLLKGQDYFFTLNLLADKPKLKIIDQYLYYYRDHAQNISNDLADEILLSVIASNHELIRRMDLQPLFNRDSRLQLLQNYVNSTKNLSAPYNTLQIFKSDFMVVGELSSPFIRCYFLFVKMWFRNNVKKSFLYKRLKRRIV